MLSSSRRLFLLLAGILRKNPDGISLSQLGDLREIAAALASIGMAGFVQRALKAGSLPDLQPLLERLEEPALGEWAVCEKALKDTLDSIAALSWVADDFIVLKGPLFAERCYGDSCARVSGDVDLLFRSQAVLDELEPKLVASGFAPFRLVNLGSLGARFRHHSWYLRNGRLHEMHWALRQHASYRIDYGKLWQDRRKQTVRGQEAFVLSAEYDLVLLLLSAFSDIQIGRFSVKSAVDLFMRLRSMPEGYDWAELIAERRRERIARACAAVLDLVLRTLNLSPELPELFEALAQRAPRAPELDEAERWTLLTGEGSQVKRKLWALRVYECAPLLSAAWWCTSLPFRVFETPKGTHLALLKARGDYSSTV